jgi:alcohol dehydrogenase
VAGVARSPEKLALLPPSVRPVPAAGADALAGADVVVDCTGSPDGLALATSLVRPGGTLVMKTTVHDLGPASPTAWVVDEVTLVGSRCGPFAPALRLLAAGLVDPTPLITARLPLDAGLEALERAAAPGGLKVLLDAGA